MKIGLFGGTFDPPHRGHELVAASLIDKGYLDEVWFVPVFKHPWADRLNKKFSAYKHRVAMLEQILEPDQRLVHFRRVSYTFDTLEYFSKKHPEHDFFWVMGSEYLPKFADFLKDHPGLLDYPFLIYPRAGYPLEPLCPNMHMPQGVPTVEASSTQIRELISQGKFADEHLHQAVAAYIKEVKLYQNKLQ